MHYCLYCSKNSIILTKHDYSHGRVGTCSSSTDPSRRPREPSKASLWNHRYVQPPRRVRKPPRRVRGGALEAPRSLLEDTLREGFAKASRRRHGRLHLETIRQIMTSPHSMCVFLPIHSGHQVRWTYQPGSHRRKVTQDFSSTFFLRCVP